ncbi:MAG: hypothetical protein E3J87_03410 [Candidatus Cloacimonadota bacterium]|nr:MAG: hypothetical protein E3J87_03410 [Candidatus Cloacimonadota bacterium]
MVALKKLFIDVGVGKPNSEAWSREEDFTIIGLEPDTNRYNNLKDVYPGKLLNMVVSEKSGEIECWEDSREGVVLFLGEGLVETFKKVKKKAIKLDDLEWGNFNEIHIWADIEGSELLMLKGATGMLSSGKVKWINLEIRKNPPIEGWARAEEVYGFLDKRGFKPGVSLGQLHERKHRDVIFIPK